MGFSKLASYSIGKLNANVVFKVQISDSKSRMNFNADFLNEILFLFKSAIQTFKAISTGNPNTVFSYTLYHNHLIKMLLVTCVPCFFMSHFGRDLNQSRDGFPRRFEMLSSYRVRHRTRQLRLKFHYY